MTDAAAAPRTQTLRYVDRDGDLLHVVAVPNTSDYYGEPMPVVALQIERCGDEDNATVYVRREDIDQLVAALHTAAQALDNHAA